MTELLRDATQLRRAMERLAIDTPLAAIDTQQLEALVEVRFRLAVDADTSPSEAIELLQGCVRLDGANPKYAYHLAQIYYEGGRLDRAREWIEAASRLCPTSHRIWSHVALLHLELNDGYAGDENREADALRRRAHAILDRVTSGEDDFSDPIWLDFEPPLSEAGKRGAQGPEAKDDDPGRGGARPADEPDSPDPSDEPEEPQGEDELALQRFLFPGRCRWSGALDLRVEQMLESAPTQRTLESLAPLLGRVCDQARRQPHGASRFAILALQFLVAGYPARTIRRLMDTPGFDPQAPSMRLLDRTCQLFEAPDRDLPAMLAEMVDREHIPPLLAAMAHRKRLLWRPMSFEATHAFRLARSMAAESRRRNRNEDLSAGNDDHPWAEVSRRLDAAIRSLDPAPPAELVDPSDQAPDQAVTPEVAMERLQGLTAAIEGLVSARNELLAFVRDHVRGIAKESQDPAEVAAAMTSCSSMPGAIDDLSSAVKRGLAEVDDLKAGVQALGSGQLPPEYDADLEARRGQLTGMSSVRNFRTFTKQANRHFSARGCPVDAADEPEEELVSLVERIKGAFPGDADEGGDTGEAGATPAGPETGPDAGGPLASPASAEPLPEGMAGLEARLDRVTAGIDRLFGYARASFDLYSPSARASAPIRSLELSVLAREAEVAYRLGRRRRALRIWRAILRRDPLDTHTAKNVAVCLTGDRESHLELAAWSDYVTRLYFEAIALGDLRHRAEERIAFHQTVADSYLPRFMCRELDRDWSSNVSASSMGPFLSSPARVRNFVQQTMLYLLNTLLSYTSPAVALGVARGDSSETRERARETLDAFAERAAAALPARVRAAFVDRARKRFAEALEDSAKAERLLLKRDTSYTDERDRHLRTLRDLGEVKLKFLVALGESSGIGAEIASVDALPWLCAIDELPLDLSKDLLDAVSASLRVTPDLLRGTDLAMRVVVNLTEYVFGEAEGAEDRTRREQQYRRLVDDWARRPAMSAYRHMVDVPQHCLPESVIDALRSGDHTSDSLAELGRWVQRYPELGGLAAFYARWLAEDKRCDEAVAVLTTARELAFWEDSRHRAAELAVQTRVMQGREDPAAVKRIVDETLAGLDHLCRRPDLVQGVLGMVVEASDRGGRPFDWRAVHRSVSAWQRRATDYLSRERGDDPDDGPSFTSEDIEEAARTCRQVIARLALDTAGGNPNENHGKVLQAMDDVLGEFPDLVEARFYRMIASMGLASARSHSGGSRDEVRSGLVAAKEDAEFVKAHTDDDHMRDQAEQALNEINRHL